MPPKYSTRYSLLDELKLIVVNVEDMKKTIPLWKQSNTMRQKIFFLNYLELKLN